MKVYTIKPLYKKSVVERTTWTRVIDESRYFLRKESTYRWGEFTIEVPETAGELLDYAQSRSYDSWKELLEDFAIVGEIPTPAAPEKLCLPDADDDYTDLTEDYDAIVEDLDDGCSVFFSVDAPGHQFFGIDGELDAREDHALAGLIDGMAEEAEEAYIDAYDDGIDNLGWEYLGMNFEITSPMEIKLK